MNQKEQRKKRKLWPILVVILLLVILAVYLWGRQTGHPSGSTQTADLKTEAACIGSISVTTEGSGSVEAASTKAITLEYDGKLETIYAEMGDQVQAGDELAIYDTDALDTVIESKEAELDQLNSTISQTSSSGSTAITAPVAGRVKRIYASDGDVVSDVVDANGGLLEISADGKLKVEFDKPDDAVSEGDTVTVDFDSYTVEGTVEKIEDGTVTVTIPDDTEYSVDTTAVVRGKSGVKLGEGVLLSNHPYLVTAEYGVIDDVNVTKTSKVSVGTTLFTRKDADYNQDYLDLLSDREDLIDEIQELKEYQKNPVVTADCDGYIVSLDVIEGMTYEKDTQFCTIADSESLHLKVEIDELDIDGVEVGQNATVVFDAFEDETYTGTVEKISGVGSNAGGVTTYTVTIALEGNARLKNAMSATATITLDSKDSALLIPVDAIETSDGQKYVQVVDGGTLTQTAVTLGLINSEYAEVTEGLSSGDLVVVNSTDSEDLVTQMMAQSQQMRDSMAN